MNATPAMPAKRICGNCGKVVYLFEGKWHCRPCGSVYDARSKKWNAPRRRGPNARHEEETLVASPEL
jgi:DNA-directed RNA polymerase subunit M/transcription elongation factor TFIIS